MQNKRIPKTDIEVSGICLGTMTFGSPVGQADAVELTHWAMNNGINFIDTANMYEGYDRVAGSSGGVAEEILGLALKGRRDKVILATKLGMKVGDSPEDEGTSAAAIKKHLDLSLRRLETDYVDIYYLHKPDEDSSLIETLGALDGAIAEGKIRHYGVSNFSAEQFAQLLQIADDNALPRPVIIQPAYSLLKRDIEKDLLPLCEKENIAVAPYQILQGGLLTGKYRREIELPADSRKAEKGNWVWELTDELFDQLEAIDDKARQANKTMLQYAISACFDHPSIKSVIVGVKNARQLQAAIDAVS